MRLIASAIADIIHETGNAVVVDEVNHPIVIDEAAEHDFVQKTSIDGRCQGGLNLYPCWRTCVTRLLGRLKSLGLIAFSCDGAHLTTGIMASRNSGFSKSL